MELKQTLFGLISIAASTGTLKEIRLQRGLIVSVRVKNGKTQL
jgi:hypothetical protein